VIADAAALVRREIAAHGIALKLDLDAGVPELVADRIQLQQVALNLMINAVQALAQASGAARVLTVRSRLEAEAAVVEVEDNGPGIAADVAASIFDAFYSTKDSGMGMGLSICRTIVEAHGGRIALADKAGPGALFRFTLPVAEAPAPMRAQA